MTLPERNIRRAQINEAGMLTAIAIQAKAHWGYSEEFMEQCRGELTVTPDDLKSPERLYSVAECDHEVVGFYCLVPLTEAMMELDDLFVHPDRIGQGIGKQLLDHARIRSLSIGATRMLIQSDPNAEDFYYNSGARLIGHSHSRSIPGRLLPHLEILLIQSI